MKKKMNLKLATKLIAVALMGLAGTPAFGQHEGHDHEEAAAGPNGGRLVRSVEPHFEFLVTEDRHVRITFLDDALKPKAPEGEVVTVTGGDRSNPTRLGFEVADGVLLSDGPLPEGNDFPIVVQVKADGNAKTQFERFTLNSNKCPTCEHAEYACICEH